MRSFESPCLARCGVERGCNNDERELYIAIQSSAPPILLRPLAERFNVTATVRYVQFIHTVDLATLLSLAVSLS